MFEKRQGSLKMKTILDIHRSCGEAIDDKVWKELRDFNRRFVDRKTVRKTESNNLRGPRTGAQDHREFLLLNIGILKKKKN